MLLQRRCSFIVGFLSMLVAKLSFAQANFDHRATASEQREAIQFNRLSSVSRLIPVKPITDTANFAYVLMSSEDQNRSEVQQLRQKIARHLPENVTLVILAPENRKEEIRQRYEQWIPKERLIIASDTSGTQSAGFWARDSFPIPVVENNNKITLQSMRYFRNFQSGESIARAVQLPVQKIAKTFVGGNLLADAEGRCFSIDSDRLFSLNANDIKTIFGCREVHLLDHVAGIGDVDEVIKPLPGKMMLANTDAYDDLFKDLGYTIVRLPTLENSYRTYANSLIVNGTVFMPAYDVSEDAEAEAVYENLGYKVIRVTSRYLSDSLHGSIHCQTMAYPAMPKEQLLKELGLK